LGSRLIRPATLFIRTRIQTTQRLLLHQRRNTPTRICSCCCRILYGDMELAQRIYEGVSKGWFMFSSPVYQTHHCLEKRSRALPISCFLTYVPDSLEGLIEHSAELRWLSVKGGGVGGHWSDVRAVSDKAPGPMPFLHTVDADMVAYRQGRTRKGRMLLTLMLTIQIL
jgi:ribonucleotide reductase alpha subunit